MQKKTRILAVSSAGGHWIELTRVVFGLTNIEVLFATTQSDYEEEIQIDCEFYVISDSTRWNLLRLIKTAIEIFWVVFKTHPEVVFSTGAAPGAIAILAGKLFGAKTIWLDSIANVSEISRSGKLVVKHVDVFLTQWEHLAQEPNIKFKGAVL